jgi:signal transduction histidine kinase
MVGDVTVLDEEHYRREALGAFAHEIRTPLTSIKMVMELGSRQSRDGQLVLDAELAEMLRTSVEDLQRLADELQETSRLERGRLVLATGPCELGAAIEAARGLLGGQPAIEGELRGEVEGPWDAPRLVRALAGFALSVNRMGDGSGTVTLEVTGTAEGVTLCFTSGPPCEASRPVSADAGFSFFRARQLVLAMGGSVHSGRAERFATVTVVLPLGTQGGGARG